MTNSQITVLVVVAIVIGFLLLFRQPTTKEISGSSDIRPGPIRHERLEPELVDRIKAFQPVFDDIYELTLEQWVEGFQRDHDPESEIAVWEAIAAALTEFAEARDLDLEARRESFVLLLDRTSRSAEDTLASAQLQFLTGDEAQKLLELYAVPPKPVTHEIK